MIKMHVKTSAAIARLRKTEKKIEKAGEATLTDLKNIGKDTAKALVPKGPTGWLYSTIEGKTIFGGKNPRAEIFLKPAIVPNDGIHRGIAKGKGWKYPRFNLARWMHESSNAKNHIRSGDPQFMYTTAEIMGARLGKVIEKNFRKQKY